MSSFRNNFKEFFEVEESLKNSDVDIIEVQHLNGYEATYYAHGRTSNKYITDVIEL